MINFRRYKNCTKIYIPNLKLSSTSFDGFQGMTNLREIEMSPAFLRRFIAFHNLCNGCTNLTTAVCGPNVKSMNYAYFGC